MDYEKFKEQMAEEVKAGLYEKGFEVDVTTRHVDKLNEGYDVMTVTPVDSNIGMCVPKSTISAYENDKVDIKSSVVYELSKHLLTSPNYLHGYKEE